MSYSLSLVKFKTTDHLFLPGLLFEPPTKTDRVALYLHGNGHSSVFYSVDKMNILADHLNKKGISFFPFNNRGAHYTHKLKRILPNTFKESTKEQVAIERVNVGTAYELIKDCIHDIDGALNFLKERGYKRFYLMGLSTGANKIVVYHYYKPKNYVDKYILLSGGDDTGLYYHEMGKKKFLLALRKCKEELQKGHGEKLIPKYLKYTSSYQSLFDTINPDGDYNIFPFNEYINHLKLSQKELFREYKTINKPTLVVYGEFDEYCYDNVPTCIEILKKETVHKKKFTHKIIPGADHGFNAKEGELAKAISKWL